METIDHRTLAATTFNRCWELLETKNRTPAQNDELLTSAFASRYHWSFAGGAEKWIISDWMVSRAANAQGEDGIAVHFAELAWNAAQDPRTPDWLLASTAEGMARAFAGSGDLVQANEWTERASKLVGQISDPEDKEIIADQLATVPGKA